MKIDRAVLHHSRAIDELAPVVKVARDLLDRGTTYIGRAVIIEGVDHQSPLTIKETIDLPPSISTQRLLEQLTPLLEKDWRVDAVGGVGCAVVAACHQAHPGRGRGRHERPPDGGVGRPGRYQLTRRTGS